MSSFTRDDIATPLGVSLRSDSTLAASRDWSSDHLLTGHLAQQGKEQGPRHPRWTRNYLLILVLIDAVIGATAVLVAGPIASAGLGLVPWSLAVAAIVWPLAIMASRGYQRANFGVGNDDFKGAFSAMIKIIVVVAFFEAITHTSALLWLVGVATPIAVVASIISRFVARKVLHARQAKGKLLRDVIAVGYLEDLTQLQETLLAEPHCGLRMVGVCLPGMEHEDAIKSDLPVLGDLDDVSEVVRQNECHAVAVTNRVSSNYLRHLSWSLEGENVDLLVHPGLMEVAGPRMHIRPHVGLPLLHIEQPHFFGWRRVLKRTFDLAATGLGLLVISPVLLTLALIVKLGDRGPVFFHQTRVGLNGEHFKMIKFRSMVTDAEARLAEIQEQNEGAGPLFKMENDPRITRVGRFMRRYSLDELPQLFNVMKGEMSLVGPRPPLESEVASYGDSTHRRLLVTPGLTGLWQVSGRSLLSWEESVRLDLRYVENWSLTLDMLILWKTAGAVVGKSGAF